MDLLGSVVKLLIPGSWSMLACAIGIGLAMLCVRGGVARIGRFLLAATLAVYVVLSLPAVAWTIERGLTRGYAPLERSPLNDPSPVIAVLGNGLYTYRDDGRVIHILNGHTAANVAEGVRLFGLLPDATIIASGGIVDAGDQTRSDADMIRERLIERGVPPERIVLETESRNTYEQVIALRRMLEARGVRPFVLVTAAIHMPRVLALCRRAGLRPMPSVPLVTYTRGRPRTWLPSLGALARSESAIYEYVALAGYRMRGRL